jgi:hypothetical protein
MAIPIMLVFLRIGGVSITAVILLLKSSLPLGDQSYRKYSPHDIQQPAYAHFPRNLSYNGGAYTWT